jgi:excisionase family DNA binding protein
MAVPVAAPEFLDTAQSLAKFLNVSTAYIRKLTRLNKLPVVRIGRAVRFDRAAVLRALEEKTGMAEVVKDASSKQ